MAISHYFVLFESLATMLKEETVPATALFSIPLVRHLLASTTAPATFTLNGEPFNAIEPNHKSSLYFPAIEGEM